MTAYLEPELATETYVTEVENATSAFNISLEEYLVRTLGPKHLALSTVVPLTVIYVLIFVTGVVGNISVCAVIVRNPSMHTATNYYLFSLAVSDLTLLILGLPNDLSVYWQQYPWALGVGLCKFRALVSEMVSYTSVLTIVAFSMERYLAICHPLHHYAMSGLKRAIKIIAILWIMSLISATPFAVFTTVNYLEFPPGSGKKVKESGFCAMLAENVPEDFPIYEISSFLFFILPMIVILILYLRMGMRIRRRAGRNSLSRRLEGSVHETRHSSSRKAIVRMLAAVVIAFFLCWAPFHAQRLLYLYAKDSPNFAEINEWMYYIAGCFYYFSSTVNPILYNVMSAKYRLAFRETLCGFIPPSRPRVQRSWNETNMFDESFSRLRSTKNMNRSAREVRNNSDHKLDQNNDVMIKSDKTEIETENTNLIGKYKNESRNSEKDGGVKNSNNVVVVITPATKKYSKLSKTSRWSKAFLRVVRSKTTSNDSNKLSVVVEQNCVELSGGSKDRLNVSGANAHSLLNSSVSKSGFEMDGNSRRTSECSPDFEGESSI